MAKTRERSKKAWVAYGKEASPSEVPPRGTVESDYWYFTKYHGHLYQKIDFDGHTFTCHLSAYDFKALSSIGRVSSTYDTFRGVVYPVRHVSK